MESNDEFERSVSLASLNFHFFLVFFFCAMSFVIAAREEPIHVSRHASVLMLRGMPLRPSGLFLQTTSLQVRGISSSMFFLSFCGPCSLTAQFPRTYHVETSVTGGPDTTQLSLKKENMRMTLDPDGPGIRPKSPERLQLFFFLILIS